MSRRRKIITETLVVWKRDISPVNVSDDCGKERIVDNFYNKKPLNHDTTVKKYSNSRTFQCMRRWILWKVDTDWHQDNSIAPMLRPNSVLSSFRRRQKLPHHYLASSQVFFLQEMSTSMRLVTLTLMSSRPLSCTKYNLRDGEKSILSIGTAIKASFTCCGNQRLWCCPLFKY